MTLQQLLGPVTAAHFVEVYYCKLPYAAAGGCMAAVHLGTWEVIGQLLAAPDVDLILSRCGERDNGSQPRTAEEGQQLVQQGCTLGIRRAHRSHPGLRELAEDFRRDFAAPVDIHLYCTPAEQTGFSWHYDAEEVFVLQIAGSKEWSLRKNTVNPWPLVETLPDDMQYEREVMPLMRCTLEAGDWLYIPGGYWHSTQAREESISLSVGIQAPAALDVLDWLRPALSNSLLWRQRLPPMGSAGAIDPDELELRLRTLFNELAADLSQRLRLEETIARMISDFSRSAQSNGPPHWHQSLSMAASGGHGNQTVQGSGR